MKLAKRKALLFGLVVCVDQLFLPQFLQKGMAWAWFFLTTVLLVLIALWQTSGQAPVQGHSRTQEVSGIPAEYLESIAKEVQETIPGEILEDVTGTGGDPENILDVHTVDRERAGSFPLDVMNLERFIDIGFVAKNTGRYESAAEWFEKALDLNPTPDLAVSLIIDIFWLRKMAVGREIAERQFRVLWTNHQSLVPPGSRFRRQMVEWMDKESLAAGYFIL